MFVFPNVKAVCVAVVHPARHGGVGVVFAGEILGIVIVIKKILDACQSAQAVVSGIRAGSDIALHADGIVELHERAGDDAVERLNGLYLPEHGGVIEAFVEIRTDVVVAQVVYGDIRAAV